MNRYGYVIAEGMIVQHVDSKEQEDIDKPAAKRDDVGSQEERRARSIELCYVARYRDE